MFLACSKDEVFQSQEVGYLSISEIDFTSEGESAPFTKAVDEALEIEIWQNGAVVPGQSYEAGSVPERIALSPGSYILKASSPDYGKEVASGIKGTPAYYNEYPFTIATGDNMSIKLTVPMRNIGLKFGPSEEFERLFPTFSIKVETPTRSYTFNETNCKEAAYFDTPKSESLSYTISAKNTDDESVGPLQKSISVKAGTIYTLTINVE